MYKVFFHNPYDGNSIRKLIELRDKQIPIDAVINVSDKMSLARFQAYRVQIAPAYVVFGADLGSVIFSVESNSIDATTLEGLTLSPPLPHSTPTLTDRIADLEEALAMLHMEMRAMEVSR